MAIYEFPVLLEINHNVSKFRHTPKQALQVPRATSSWNIRKVLLGLDWLLYHLTRPASLFFYLRVVIWWILRIMVDLHGSDSQDLGAGSDHTAILRGNGDTIKRTAASAQIFRQMTPGMKSSFASCRESKSRRAYPSWVWRQVAGFRAEVPSPDWSIPLTSSELNSPSCDTCGEPAMSIYRRNTWEGTPQFGQTVRWVSKPRNGTYHQNRYPTKYGFRPKQPIRA